MFSFITRRLVQAVFTLLGVMLLTFVLFRLTTGDVSAQFVNPKLGKEARVDWLRKNKLDLPMVLNFQRRVTITDTTTGSERFDVRSAEDTRDVVHRAVQALVEGELVAIPTETVYGLAASAMSESAVERLLAAKGRAADQPLALAVRSAEEALDYVPDMCSLGQRLARRCWPGPITLVLSVAQLRERAAYSYPEEQVMVG